MFISIIQNKPIFAVCFFIRGGVGNYIKPLYNDTQKEKGVQGYRPAHIG